MNDLKLEILVNQEMILHIWMLDFMLLKKII